MLGAISSGIGGLIGSGFNAIGDALGISGAAREWKYKKKELNLQHQLNEESAQNAYDRQMQMYEKSYQDNSYAAMRDQMEDAGLSVGMMYGGSGSGGGAGSTSGAPQAQGAMAGGVTAEDMALNYRSLEADIQLKEAEAQKAQAEANQLDKTGERTAAETKTIEKLRDVLYENQKQEAWMKFIKNATNEFINDGSNFYTNPDGVLEVETTKYWNETLNRGFVINGESIPLREMMAELEKTIAEKDETISKEKLNKVLKTLKSKEAENYFLELTAKLKNAEANMTAAQAQEIVAQAKKRQIALETGDETNWMTGLKILTELAGIVSGNAKAAGMVLAALL